MICGCAVFMSPRELPHDIYVLPLAKQLRIGNMGGGYKVFLSKISFLYDPRKRRLRMRRRYGYREA